MQLRNREWIVFFSACRIILGQGAWEAYKSESWCAFTTFSSLRNGVVYWNCGMPDECDLLTDRTADGGLWRQSFKYSDIAHIVIPATFSWERIVDGNFDRGTKIQDIVKLSSNLSQSRINHRITGLILEIKLY